MTKEIDREEKIICSAICINGVIYVGKRHSDAFIQLDKAGVKTAKTQDQGFYTNKFRFVDRYEGLEIANKAKQTIREAKGLLFSEDLW